MAKKESLETFAKNLHRFNDIILNNVLKTWQNYTFGVLGTAQENVPILTGFLLRSGSQKKAVTTAKGIESQVVFTMPYARRIESGEGIELKPKGYKYPHATKERKGRTGFLSFAVEKEADPLMIDLKKDIGNAFNKI